jgi:exopolyphosphatase / guanosine-5'-triphosphate,3'-diphosphate pyrophosphatase
MRLAALDIGSNTVHILVADVVRGKLVDVAHYVEMPELGPQVAKRGSIGSRGRVALRALRKVIGEAKAHGYDHLVACATEAVRKAKDGPAFVKQAAEVIGAPVRVISAKKEAQLSFLGAASRHAVRGEWVLVDMGGASTEIVIAEGHRILRSTSLPIGSGVLAATYLKDPPRPEERARLRRAALRELAQAPDGDVDRLVATGGTASNLPSIVARRNPPAVLTTADLLTCEARLDGRRAGHLAVRFALPASRIKALRAGVEALLLLLDWYGLALLHVSHEGLRHGMQIAYLERGEEWWRDG